MYMWRRLFGNNLSSRLAATNPPVGGARASAWALMLSQIPRLGESSPASLVFCDTFLARDVCSLIMDNADTELWAMGIEASTQASETFPWLSSYHDWREVSSMRGRVCTVACGVCHTAVVTNTGELWTTGLNKWGQLGLGDTENRREFTRVYTFVLASTNALAVACGSRHTLAIACAGRFIVPFFFL